MCFYIDRMLQLNALLEPVGVPTGLCWGFYFSRLLLEYLTCICWYVVRMAFNLAVNAKLQVNKLNQ